MVSEWEDDHLKSCKNIPASSTVTGPNQAHITFISGKFQNINDIKMTRNELKAWIWRKYKKEVNPFKGPGTHSYPPSIFHRSRPSLESHGTPENQGASSKTQVWKHQHLSTYFRVKVSGGDMSSPLQKNWIARSKSCSYREDKKNTASSYWTSSWNYTVMFLLFKVKTNMTGAHLLFKHFPLKWQFLKLTDCSLKL